MYEIQNGSRVEPFLHLADRAPISIIVVYRRGIIMLTQRNRNEIKEMVEKGTESVDTWLDSLEDQINESPEDYSGEIIDKRPEEKKRKAVAPLDFQPEDILDISAPAIEIELGALSSSRWRSFKGWFSKNILRRTEKTETEEVNELMKQFGLFSDLHDGESMDPAEPVATHKPKNILPALDVLRQAVAFAELMMSDDIKWDDIRHKCKVLRKKLNTNLTAARSAGIPNSNGSRVTLDVEVSKEVEIPPEVISREIMAARRMRSSG